MMEQSDLSDTAVEGAMSDELTVCAAAFFRSIGKDVTTSEEFVMGTSLEMKWMSPSDSKLLLKRLVETGVLVLKGDFVRPATDVGAIDVPLAYRPSAELLESIRSKPVKKAIEQDMFHTLMDVAVGTGMERRDFIQNCNKVQKGLGIDIGAAALIVLRDNGVDITPYVEGVYSEISVG